MRTDEEVGEHVVFGSALSAVTHKRLAGQKQGRARQLDHCQLKLVDGFVERLNGREGQRQFGIDDRVDRQPVKIRS